MEPSSSISPRDAIEMYNEYLTDSVTIYVDSNNKVVEWQESTENSISTR